MRFNLIRPLQLFKYFPLRAAASLMVCEATRALLNPHARHAYAQTGEDQILASYLDVSRPGFYVDVGCSHPCKGSNTFFLYTRGWRGLAVDGNPAMIRLFKRFRPRDRCVCAVVSNQENTITFTIAKAPELSTVSPRFAQKRIGVSGVDRRIEVDTVRLQTLLEETGAPHAFELLSIDVEDHDFEVLRSFDMQTFRPRLVVVEMHGFEPGQNSTDPVYAYLTQRGYKLKSYSVMNGIFMDTRT